MCANVSGPGYFLPTGMRQSFSHGTNTESPWVQDMISKLTLSSRWLQSGGGNVNTQITRMQDKTHTDPRKVYKVRGEFIKGR